MQQGFQTGEPQYQPPESQKYRGGRVELQSGVVKFMSGVYAWMAAGLAVTALTVVGLASSPSTLMTIVGLGWIPYIAAVAFIWIFGSRAPRMEPGMATVMFMVFCAMIGVMVAPLLSVTPLALIGQTLAVTMGMFIATAFFGWTTKKDLTGMGQFFFMAAVGVILAGIANAVFVQSAGFGLGVSAVIVLLFAGMTAYHTQAIKQLYLVRGAQGNLAIVGALSLYLDFYNMFISLLHILGAGDD